MEVIPLMSKRKYQATAVKDVNFDRLTNALGDRRVVVAVDVAKEDFFAAFVDEDGKTHEIVKWKHPKQSCAFLALISQVRERGPIEVAMEPSGVYGDALRVALLDREVAVFRVNPKRVHDAAEVFDGVPSLHDAKSATLIARLHLAGASEAWPLDSEHRRRLAAALRILEVHEKEVRRNRGRLEGYLARHWPELTGILSLDSATLLEVLVEYGGAAGVAADPEGARALMKRVGGRFLAQDKIDAAVESAMTSFGVPQVDEELRLVKEVAKEALRQRRAGAKARRRVEELAAVDGSATGAMMPVVGKTTAAVLVAGVGDPRRYESAAAFEKALGLNLKEKSSGKQKGGLHITKRGPGVARMFLYLAVLRLLQRDAVVRAWYAKKVKRDAGRKQKALIALMRKLSRALWHVAAGSEFDSAQLFDATRLKLAA